MKKQLLIFAIASMFSLTCWYPAIAAARQASGTEAIVTAIDGTVHVFAGKETAGRRLKKGDTLSTDQEVRVGERSRMEIRFPDGTVMRLSERSRFSMNELNYNSKTQGKNVKVNLGLGKLWANVRKLVTPDSSVEVKTVNAVAGVRGTVYRVNVEEDKSAMVKVYDGSVYVANPPKEPGGPDDAVSAPREVPGPHEVPPPFHEVSLEEWTAIVQAMQQISISAQGVPTKPEAFDPKTDADDWVKWNQERDKRVRF
jgi:hypothetical protein